MEIISKVRTLPLIGRLSLRLLIGLCISLVCLILFAIIADNVVNQRQVVNIDIALANALYAQATPLSTALYNVVSFISMPGIWILAVIIGIYFIWKKAWLNLIVWIIALAGGLLINEILKSWVARPRPVFDNPLVFEPTFSFPSGHAMIAIIGYGLIAYFVLGSVPNRFARIVLFFAISLLITLIGISRMGLGVHYLSDVIAGFFAGAVWLSACITAIDTIHRSKQTTV